MRLGLGAFPRDGPGNEGANVLSEDVGSPEGNWLEVIVFDENGAWKWGCAL